jgi:Zn-dependent alcohol dehydrogenase
VGVTIRAAVLPGENEQLHVADVELDAPEPGEVRVRLAASGVCASDWHTLTGRIPSPLPAVLGHEGAGVVEETGAGVGHVAPGDHVVLSWLPACGRCRYCESGRPVLCDVAAPAMLAGTLLNGGRRLRLGSRRLYHYSFLSTFAEQAVVPAASCVPVRRDVPLAVASLAGCAVMTGYGAVVNRARVTPGSAAVIFGAGGVGLSCVMAAALAGAAQVIAVDPVPAKRRLAASLGATRVIDPAAEDVVAAVREATGGDGADFGFDAVGSPAVSASAFDAVCRGGTLVCIGLPGPDAMTAFPGPRLVREEKIVTGSLYGSCRPFQDIPALLDLVAAGRLPIDKLVSATYGLGQINDAFADMIAGRLARGVVVLSEDIAW